MLCSRYREFKNGLVSRIFGPERDDVTNVSRRFISSSPNIGMIETKYGIGAA
jgi:hypothetical protein